jgi:predicted hotdog family 3-hydroxylacyl-ACP dehydratase
MPSLEPNILSLIPQRKPFVMIDNLLRCDDVSTQTNFRVIADNIFVKNGKLHEPALVENIAQTAAARLGWLSRLANRAVPLGYIGAIKNLEIHDLPKINDLLETKITVENQIFDVSIIQGKIHCNGNLIAQCEMRIFIDVQS